MAEEYKASKAIYMQIADSIIHRIVRGELTPGDKLPSVREMAIQSNVNPNTIQRTYSELERMEVVESRRGQGTFVIEDETLVSSLKRKVHREITGTYVENMKELGISVEDIVEELQNYLEERREK
ncbi:GntR family transcriptional regulator [Rossellomorea sp. BNER]|jgi:GntR family transcriptional regulator|uniref:GntR family transcriptional regulator n=1 Tax=Rossellomorea sp. BNER TaxID=2962031 RepID=UPI003AF30BD4|nr:GntR family transcriptional regulator [Rossellomorea sp. BNER]